MNKKYTEVAIPDETVISKIFIVIGKKVMIDTDLAGLYRVTTKRLSEQVKRNVKRFPADFMFQLSQEEKQWLIEKRLEDTLAYRVFTAFIHIMFYTILPFN